MEKTENPIKKACRELGITQKELAEKIGLTEGGMKTAIVRDNYSNQMRSCIKLLLENNKLQNQLNKYEGFKTDLKEFILQ